MDRSFAIVDAFDIVSSASKVLNVTLDLPAEHPATRIGRLCAAPFVPFVTPSIGTGDMFE